MLTTVTLRLAARLKVRVAREARKKGMRIEDWVRETVEREVERRARFLDYIRRAQRTGMAIEALTEEDDARQRVRLLLRELESGSGSRKRRRIVRRI